jgi:hypothetical protein
MLAYSVMASRVSGRWGGQGAEMRPRGPEIKGASNPAATSPPRGPARLVPLARPAYMPAMLRRLPFLSSAPLVNVVRLSGMIAAGPRGLNDQLVGPLLERAFRRGAPKAVALVINSPGGSPAQSSLIGARIRRLAEEKSVPSWRTWRPRAGTGSPAPATRSSSTRTR